MARTFEMRAPHVVARRLGVIASSVGLALALGCAGAADRPAEPSTPPAPGPPRPMNDAIDRLADRLSASPLWTNGVSPRIDLPEGAATEALIGAALLPLGFDRGKVTRHAIVHARRVAIGADPRPYLAALVDTNLGRMIVLLRHEGPNVGWWSRVFQEGELP